ncbi:MAG: hypothetical protein OXG33_08825 [Chloroflexi bacterium]|nr:hypothetical protein [Chloroflexota bacterium]
MARAGPAVGAPAQLSSDRDRRDELASRLAREPQIAALEAVAEWAETQGVSLESVGGMREVIAAFAANTQTPNLDLAMRARRRRIVSELRSTG